MRLPRRKSQGLYVIWADFANGFFEDRCAHKPYCKGKIEKVEETYDSMGNGVKLEGQYACSSCGATYLSSGYDPKTNKSLSNQEVIHRCSSIRPSQGEWRSWFSRNGYIQVTRTYLHFFRRTKWQKKNRLV